MAFHVVAVVSLCCGYRCVGLYHVPLSCCQVRMDCGANVLDRFLRECGSAEQHGCQRGIGESFALHRFSPDLRLPECAESLPVTYSYKYITEVTRLWFRQLVSRKEFVLL